MTFGSYTYTPPPEINDLGFGSPFNPDARNIGFGSPFDPGLTAVATASTLISDDGGDLVSISGNWASIAPEPVPSHSEHFTVHFIHAATAREYPALAGYLGRRRSGQVYTNMLQNVIRAYTPPMDRGTYHIRISYETGNLLLNNAVTVVARNRNIETYSIRRSLPAFYKTGSREAAQESVDVQDYSTVEALTRSVGQVIQRLASTPFTLLTQTWNEGDTTLHVESTLGLDPTGHVLVNGIEFSYSGKTNDTLTGVVRTSTRAVASILDDAKVLRHEPS